MDQAKPKKRFGDILVDGGLITATQLHQALAYASDRRIKLGMALQKLGLVNDVAVAKTLASQLGLPFVDVEKIVIDSEIVNAIPELVARKYKVIALGRKPGEVLVAFADPLNIFAIDEVKKHSKGNIVMSVAAESKIIAVIDWVYDQQSAHTSASPGNVEESEAVKAVNDMMLQAVKGGASDIHLEPTEKFLRVRSRVDGVMRVNRELPLELHPSIISRIKVLAHMDIGEKRKPQDGRFEMPVGGRDFDVRVSTLPIKNGEKVVMRLLDKSRVKIDLQELGLDPDQVALFKKHLYRPHDVILVTGPTGSGKTTTLYAALNLINSIEKNIVTVEDPVEYELAGVNQVQVNPRADLTFASALRSILRQDPDVVMIGEIRDVETAEITIQAALTGHLVLSTLHTNDSCGSITRLIDMGIPPFLIASAVGAVIAQRLVRRLCKDCRTPFNPPPKIQKELGLAYDPERVFYQIRGCPKCEHTGYFGRMAIYEILSITPNLETMIMERASAHELYRQALNDGLVSLRRSGIAKVVDGLTSLDEVLRVTMDSRG
jgi:type IV pilus assembly protein PilB